MQVQTAFERTDEVLFLDVRERYEWDAGHIDGSLHIPLMELPARTGEVPRDRTVVVVCQIGQRSDLAANFLRDNGFDAHNLEGGMSEWVSQGLPCAATGGGDGDVVDGYARDFDGLL